MRSYIMPAEMANRSEKDGCPLYTEGVRGEVCDYYLVNGVRYINTERVFDKHDRFLIALHNISATMGNVSARRISELMDYNSSSTLSTVMNRKADVSMRLVGRLRNYFNINPDFFKGTGSLLDLSTGTIYKKSEVKKATILRADLKERYVSEDLWLLPDDPYYSRDAEARWEIPPTEIVEWYEAHPGLKCLSKGYYKMIGGTIFSESRKTLDEMDATLNVLQLDRDRWKELCASLQREIDSLKEIVKLQKELMGKNEK